MNMKLGDHRVALAIKDVIRTIADGRIDKLRPPDRYAVVQSVDYAALKATVLYHNGTNLIPVPFPHNLQPTDVGQLVRVSGGRTNRYVSALVSPPLWTAPAMTNSWVPFGGTIYGQVAYARDAAGFVHLRGLMKLGTNALAAFDLPAGYRPAFQRVFRVTQGDSTSARLDIMADGSVTPVNVTNTAFVSLDGVTFKAASS